MFVLSELSSNGKKGRKFGLHQGTVYVVGRGNGNIVLSDKTVSRNHAIIIAKKEMDIAFVAITDLSSSNGTKINSVTLTPNKEHKLFFGSNIQFGLNEFSLEKENLIVTCTTLSSHQEDVCVELIQKQGAKIVTDWDPSITHVIASNSKVTKEILYAIIKGQSLVQIDFFKERWKSIQTGEPLPWEADFTIHKFDLQSSVEINYKCNRECLFANRVFIFSSELERLKKFGDVLEMCGGQTITVYSMSFSEQDFQGDLQYMLVKSDSNPTTPQMQKLVELYERLGQRFITEQEISAAVITGDTLNFCNSRCMKVERLIMNNLEKVLNDKVLVEDSQQSSPLDGSEIIELSCCSTGYHEKADNVKIDASEIKDTTGATWKRATLNFPKECEVLVVEDSQSSLDDSENMDAFSLIRYRTTDYHEGVDKVEIDASQNKNQTTLLASLTREHFPKKGEVLVEDSQSWLDDSEIMNVSSVINYRTTDYREDVDSVEIDASPINTLVARGSKRPTRSSETIGANMKRSKLTSIENLTSTSTYAKSMNDNNYIASAESFTSTPIVKVVNRINPYNTRKTQLRLKQRLREAELDSKNSENSILLTPKEKQMSANTSFETPKENMPPAICELTMKPKDQSPQKDPIEKNAHSDSADSNNKSFCKLEACSTSSPILASNTVETSNMLLVSVANTSCKMLQQKLSHLREITNACNLKALSDDMTSSQNNTSEPFTMNNVNPHIDNDIQLEQSQGNLIYAEFRDFLEQQQQVLNQLEAQYLHVIAQSFLQLRLRRCTLAKLNSLKQQRHDKACKLLKAFGYWPKDSFENNFDNNSHFENLQAMSEKATRTISELDYISETTEKKRRVLEEESNTFTIEVLHNIELYKNEINIINDLSNQIKSIRSNHPGGRNLTINQIKQLQINLGILQDVIGIMQHFQKPLNNDLEMRSLLDEKKPDLDIQAVKEKINIRIAGIEKLVTS